MSTLHQAYIALGANLGDPVATIQDALERLATFPKGRLVTTSSLYRTAPLGFLNQPDFINAVAHLETSLTPLELLAELLALEKEFGRIRQEKNGPRTLDIDLLLFDNITLDTPGLTLPHPRLHLRAFVLIPLAEIAPELCIPGHGRVSDWLPAIANQSVIRLP